MQERPSRRSVLAATGTLAAAALAGCTGGGSSDATTSSDPTDATAADATTETTEATATTADAAPSVDWDEVAAFRTWLTDYSTLPSSNHRFDYQSVGLDRLVSSGRAAFLDLSTDDVAGFLTQSANALYLGDFDAGSLDDAVEASENHELTGEYEGYATAEATEAGTEFALGGDAVLAGSGLTEWIDAHRGARPRLEETDLVFTRIFRRLPDREVVTAQRGPPAGGEIDAEAIDAWGTSMPSLRPESATWVYALAPDTSGAEVDELASELAASAFTEEVTDRTVDGRFATFTATVALPE
jgi:hypothetical protein